MIEKTVQDARGRAIRVPPPELGVLNDLSPRGRLNAIRAAAYGAPAGVWTRLIVAGVVGVIAAGFAYWLALRSLSRVDRFGSAAFALVMGVFGVFGVFRLGVKAPDPKAVADGVFRLKICVCGYDLKDVPRAEDGCSVCPECGGAWRVASEIV